MHHPVLDLLNKYHVHTEIKLLKPEDPRPFHAEDHGHAVTFYINPPRYKKMDEALYFLARTVLLPHLSFETKRLSIRHFQKGDGIHLFESMSDKETCYLDGGYEPESVMNEKYIQTIDEFSKDPTRFVIALKENNHAIGMIHVMNVDDRQVEAKEIGYLINPSQRRKGYAYEAVSAMIHILQGEFKLDLILLGACEKNTASLSMIKKLGFTFEGRKHKAFWDAEQRHPVDLLYYYKDLESEDVA